VNKRNPTFKPTEEPTQLVFQGPIRKDNGEELTWVDEKTNPPKTFYLLTVTDSGNNEMTWFCKDYVREMIKEIVPEGGQFSVVSYGRKGRNNKFFGDVSIDRNGKTFLAEKWDASSSSGATKGTAEERPAQASVNQPSSPKEFSDDIGLMVECFTNAARVLLAEPVVKACASLAVEPTFEDLRALAISIAIDRKRQNEKGPRNPAYAYKNLSFVKPDTDNPPYSPPTEPNEDDIEFA
jgi:hypothetical protein